MDPVGAVTLAQVAARAGVSQPTASRVLNGSERKPAPGVVAAVRKAAEELGYIANAQAQALARATSGLLGLVVHDIADPYFSALAAGAQEAADALSRQVMLAVTLRRPEQELAAVQTFIAHRADAIMLTGSQWSDRKASAVRKRLRADLDRYVAAGGHVCVVGRSLPGAHAVVPGNRSGAAALAQALVEQGTRNFVILGGPPRLATAMDRTTGFVTALAARGIKPTAVVPGDFTRDGGYVAAQEALVQLRRGGPAPPCIFAVNDVMAIGAMAALRTAGYHVPLEVQVAGFDDISTLRDHSPRLSTVRLPLHEMGRRAAELALSGERELVTHRVPGHVVLRESTMALTRDSQPTDDSDSRTMAVPG